MKKSKSIISFVCALILFAPAFGQDVGVSNIITHNSGCDLQYPQTVSIEITNYSGTDLATLPFTLTYQLNNNPVITQNATLTIGSGSSITFTFAVAITAGINYGADTIVSSATNLLDGNSANNAFTKIFNNDRPTVGGDVTPDTSFCDVINSGEVTLNGFLGVIKYWQSSTNNGASWVNITNVTTMHSYNNLDRTTLFRSAVQNGNCKLEFSQASTIIIERRPSLPIVSSNGPVCMGTTLNLYSSSTDRSLYNWTGPNGYASTEQNPVRSIVDSNTDGVYKVVASIDRCVSDTAQITVKVVNRSIGGNTMGGRTVCLDNNQGELYLTGHSGNIARWEYSINGGNEWIVLSDDTPVLEYFNLNQTRAYRAFVVNGNCPGEHSEATTIHVSYKDCAKLAIANLLTPNGDGKNDTWLIQQIEPIQELSVKIFNRSGIEIYQSTDYKNDWDGSSNGERLQDGTYYYLININGTSIEYKGAVNLIR